MGWQVFSWKTACFKCGSPKPEMPKPEAVARWSPLCDTLGEPFDEGAQLIGPSATQHSVSNCWSCSSILELAFLPQVCLSTSEMSTFLKTRVVSLKAKVQIDLIVDSLWVVSESTRSTYVYGRAISSCELALAVTERRAEEVMNFWDLQVDESSH